MDKKQKSKNISHRQKQQKNFQCAVTVVLNNEEIKKLLQRIKIIKSFIDKYNWEDKNYPSDKYDWKKFEKNNLTFALRVLYAKKEKKNILSIPKNMILIVKNMFFF